jgi:NADH:ubiquinone oxidoreductase subunit F (NADH-binding)
VLPSSGQTLPGTDGHRLLGHSTDLDGHVGALGPLPVQSGSLRSWQQWFGAELEASGLGGRGGASFPASIKLALARSGGGKGIVVVNGMEGEPASDKDKVLLTRTPHLVLDGAQLLAAACRAREVVVCVPHGRDGVARAVEHAMAERRAASYATIPEVIARPPDRFVAGEESALVQWVDSGRSLPSFRPDKGVGLHIGRRPVLVHNAETLAHIALIGRYGAASFRARGLTEEPGTTLVTVTGAVTHPGVVEVDRGTPLLDIVARAQPADPLGAILVGGYGGTWVGPEGFDTPYASLPLRTIGASSGVGVLVALEASACGVAETARIARYLAQQSSGQCGPCVFGLPAIADDLALLARGAADRTLIARLARRLDEVDGRGACRHPDGAVAMVRSAMLVFAADAADHWHGSPCARALRPTQLRFPATNPQ